MADPARPLWCEAALVGGWGVDRNGEVSEDTIGTAALRDVIPDEEMRALASIICTVDDARRLATEVIKQRNGNEAECPCCIHSAPTHADGCPLGCLLALLSEDGTP